MKLKKILAGTLAGAVVMGSMAMSAFAGNVETDATFDPTGATEYHAGLYIQFGGQWSFRDPYNNDATGKMGGYAGADKVTICDGKEVGTEFPGTFTDVTITGNGTYTVSVDGIDLTGDPAPTNINLIGITTDIPCIGSVDADDDEIENDVVKFTDIQIVVNDSSVTTAKIAQGTPDFDKKKPKTFVNVMGVNIWNEDVCGEANAVLGTTDVWPAGGVKSAKITFTVSGFDVDAAPAETEAPSEEETEATATTAAATTAAAKSDDSKDDSKSGLPVGAIVGIVAGVVVVVGVIVVVSKKKK